MQAVTAGTALAGPLSASQIFTQFNAVIFNNFNSSSDVEGRTVVGGNLTRGASFDTKPVNAAASAYAALTVYGTAAGGNININNGGGVTIAGSNAGSYNLNGGGNVYVGGANSGNVNIGSGASNVTIVGANSGTLGLNGGGKVYLGGNTGGINAGGPTTLAINGNTANTLNLNGGGTVSLNGSNTGTISLNGGSLLYTGSKGTLNLNNNAMATPVGSLSLTPPASPLTSFASTFQTPLTTLSTQLSTLQANSTTTRTNGALTFAAAPNASGSAVFDLNASALTPNTSVAINLNGATSVIINVDVDTCAAATCAFALPNSLNFLNPTSYAADVLWNFANASSLSFSGEFGGSVLAPWAAVTNNSPIDGTLIAASYTGNGELHSHPFTGSLPNTDPAPVPEPASVLLFGGGVIGLAAIRRRMTRARAAQAPPAPLI